MAVRDRSGAGLRAGLALAAILAASPLAGQGVHNVHLVDVTEDGSSALESARLRFEPWGGVLFDAYRNDGGNGNPAWIGAVRLGYELGAGLAAPGRGWRLIAEVARAEAAEAGTALVQDSFEVGFRTEWWLLTGGAEWDALGGGWTGLTVEARAGAAWLQREIVGGDTIPPGTPGTSDRAESAPFPAVVAGLSVWRHVTHRVQVRLRVEDVITDPFDAVEHSPALGVGIRFVFE